jgi:hypothetical protein
VPCGTVNKARRQLCRGCGKRKWKRKTSKDKHMAVLQTVTYEQCVAIYGERCGICAAGPKTKALQRDHEHKGDGALRGLLCFRCNAALRDYMTLDWLRNAVAYLERFEARREGSTDGDG